MKDAPNHQLRSLLRILGAAIAGICDHYEERDREGFPSDEALRSELRQLKDALRMLGGAHSELTTVFSGILQNGEIRAWEDAQKADRRGGK